MTNMKRLSVSIPEDLENRLFNMRKNDEFVRCTFAEIIRIVLEKGVDVVERDST